MTYTFHCYHYFLKAGTASYRKSRYPLNGIAPTSVGFSPLISPGIENLVVDQLLGGIA